jgi:hypothetical protein
MIKKNVSIALYYLFFCFCSNVHAQSKTKKMRVPRVQVPSVETIYDNIDYVPEIKTIEFFNTKKEQSIPILNLGGDDRLILKFDDLRTGSKNIYYTFQHCNGDWEPSNITQLDYLDGFTYDRINQYRNAANTYQKYIHYEIIFPNNAVTMPKLAGNYLLKIYEDGDESRLLFTRRFYVVNAKMFLQAEIIPSNNVNLRRSNQKINFTVQSPGIIIQNPYQDIRIQILQNRRYDLAKWTKRPVFIKNNLLIYNELNSNDFAGGNEFTFFDTRSFRLKSQKVFQIIRDSLFYVSLFADVPKPASEGYTFNFDENGKFFIRNQDGLVQNPDADYAITDFALKIPQPFTTGNVYVVGLFNQYQKNETNKMIYNAETKQYTLKMLMKQGVYDYNYSIIDATGKLIDSNFLNGSYFDTDNDYQLFVYYRQPGSRFEELVAFAELNSSKTPRTQE